jgi:hypothetical protein
MATGPKAGNKPKGEGKKDMSKVKCFACHKFGHYAGQCPNKKRKQIAASTKVEEFSTKFNKDFSLVVCLSTRATHSSVWYIDSGASRHMTGVRGYLTNLTQIGDLEVALRDDQVVKAVSSGTVSFQKESQPPMLLRDVLYVPGLKKNLISVSTIEKGGMRCCSVMDRCSYFPRGPASLRSK